METIAIIPGRSLGPVCLGASLHEVLTVIKAQKSVFPVIDLHHSSSKPLETPVAVALPQNGLRLLFDAAEQRLRLIEVLDFGKVHLTYKGNELVKTSDDSTAPSRPGFRRIYQLFGASYPGEYHAPTDRDRYGSYVLSWPGIAVTFPLEHAAYGEQKDHVTMLGSSAASAATQMALFEGNSWPEVRKDLFISVPNGPRLSAIAQRPRDNLPAEIEFANIKGDGKITLVRTPPEVNFVITLNQTTPQDLITELGPPDATRKRDTDLAFPQQTYHHRRTSSAARPLTNGRGHPPGSQPSSFSSTNTDTFDADFDSGDGDSDDPLDRASRETFWCYFSHGMDILVGPPSPTSTSTSATPSSTSPTTASTPHLTVTKVIIHGNIPGSYAFNRHRRLRWQLDIPSDSSTPERLLSSEDSFPTTIQPALLRAFRDVWPENEMSRGKVVNRTWGGSNGGGSDSAFFLPDGAGGEGEELLLFGGGGGGGEGGLLEGSGSESWLGNSRVYSFPGLGVEVLENGFVAGLGVW